MASDQHRSADERDVPVASELSRSSEHG